MCSIHTTVRCARQSSTVNRISLQFFIAFGLSMQARLANIAEQRRLNNEKAERRQRAIWASHR